MGKRSPGKSRKGRSSPSAGLTKRQPPLSPVASYAFLVGFLAFLVYLSAIPGDFVFDDKLIQRDPRILQADFGAIFTTDYWNMQVWLNKSAGPGDLYRPLTIASYAANLAVSGLNPNAFHAVNVALHVLASVLLVALVQAVLRNRPIAFVTGLLFATHPVHTEAVAGIVGRAELLVAVFLLASLYLHTRAYSLWGLGKRLWLPVSLLAYFSALLSKENAIVGLGLVVLIDYVRYECWSSRATKIPMSRLLRGVAPYVGVAVVYLIVRYQVLGQLLTSPPPRPGLLLYGEPFATRLFTGLGIFARYLKLLIFPVTLSADYSYRQVPIIHSPDSPYVLIGAIGVVFLVVAFLGAIRKRAPVPVFAVGFFAITYSVVSNVLTPIGTLMGERLLYLPSIGFCIGVAWLWVRAHAFCREKNRWASRSLEAILILVLFLYGARTSLRNLDWRNAETLYAATVRAAPECQAAHFNYSAILLQRQGSEELALKHLLKSVEIRPDHYPSLVNLTAVYLRLDQPRLAEEAAERGLEVRPDSRKLQGLLATARKRLRREHRRAG